MLGEPADAEDAVQHVFAAAHRELVQHDRPLRLKAWLYTVARNRCLSMLRDRHEYPDDALEPSTAGLHQEVQQRADLREVLTDLHDLPDDQRAALVLSELEDLSHAEIAGVLGCRVESVKGLVFRARAGLMERHEARDASCLDIRAELAVARRGGLRRGRLKHHLKACPSCAAYLEDLRRQRRMLALVLPVVPTATLKPGLLASLGLGGGAAAGGGLATAGTAGTAATIAVAAVMGGAGLAGQGPLASDSPPGKQGGSPSGPEVRAPAAAAGGVPSVDGPSRQGRDASGAPQRGARPGSGGARRKAPSRVRRGAERRAAGRFEPPRATPRGTPKGGLAKGKVPSPQKGANRTSARPAPHVGPQHPAIPPGRAKSFGPPSEPKPKAKEPTRTAEGGRPKEK